MFARFLFSLFLVGSAFVAAQEPARDLERIAIHQGDDGAGLVHAGSKAPFFVKGFNYPPTLTALGTGPLDFLDVHFYRTDRKESVDEAFRLNLGSTGFFTPEMAGIRRRKPVIMGEFGAFDHVEETFEEAVGQIEQLGLALSDNLMDWRRHPHNPVIPHGPKGSYNQQFSADAKVFRDGDHWVAFFFGVGKGGAHIMAAFSRDLLHWTVDPEPPYKAGGNPSGLDRTYAHKISLVWNPANETFYMFYNAVGNQGRGIGLITSKPLAGGS